MSLLDYLSQLGSLTCQNSSVTGIKQLNVKYLGLFFTAQWCKSCKYFIQKLQPILEKLQRKHPSKFKIITIPLNSPNKSFNHKFWKFSKIELWHSDYLSSYFGIMRLPHIIVLNRSGHVVSNQGLMDLLEYQQNVSQQWDKTNS